jgi:hypothetical protein
MLILLMKKFEHLSENLKEVNFDNRLKNKCFVIGKKTS